MCAHSSPLGEPGTNPGWTSWTSGFYRFSISKAGLAALRIMVVFGATPAGVPLAYADSPSREHARPTIICTALVFLRLSVLRCSCHPQRCAAYARARPRAWARSSMAAAALPRAALPPDWRATRTENTVSHHGRRHRVVWLPGNHWRTRALRERADGRTGTGAPLLLGLSVGTYTEGWSSALPSLARCLPPSPLPPPSLPPR